MLIYKNNLFFLVVSSTYELRMPRNKAARGGKGAARGGGKRQRTTCKQSRNKKSKFDKGLNY